MSSIDRSNKFARLLSLAMVVATVGCTKWSLPRLDFSEPAAEKKATGPLQVKVDANGLPLRDGQLTSPAVPELLRRCESLLTEKRQLSLQHEVSTRLDAALELLRGLKEEQVRTSSAVAIAGVYDELLGVPTQDGWRVVIDAAVQRDANVRQYATDRAQWLDHVRQGSFNSLDGDRLTRQAGKTPGKMLVIDSWHLRGISALVADRPADAVKSFQQAASLAASVDPYQSAQAGLLLSDALRRAGNAEQADRTWHETVIVAARLTSQNPPLGDPAFWDKASYLRPVVHPWPDEVVALLEKSGAIKSQQVDPAVANANPTVIDLQHTPGDQEAIVWGWIGDALLQRNEGQPALVALKRAESAAQTDVLKQQCRLHQAHALVRLGQMAPATAILVSLTADKNPQLSKSATAALGSLKFHQGDVTAAHRLLTKALEEGTPVEWDGRTDAESDLGLVTLLRGDDAGGLKRVRLAQMQYESRGDRLALARSLWNEQKFLEHAGKKNEAKATKVRWQELESNATIVR